jgi:hypothetical protein
VDDLDQGRTEADVLHPATTPLVYDTDGYGRRNAHLDPEDNHGAAGANMVFCDYHAEWVSGARWSELDVPRTHYGLPPRAPD